MPSAADLAPRLQQSLLLDWDDPLLRGPLFVAEDGTARKKLADLAGPRSDGAVTWSAFRTLMQFPASVWLPRLLGVPAEGRAWEPATLDFWVRAPPLPARLLWLLDHLDTLAFYDTRQEAAAKARLQRVAASLDRWRAQAATGADRGDGILEPPYEADVVVTTPTVTLGVAGLYRHDIEARTAWDPQRDAIARGLDAALDLAGAAREPWYLLVTDDYRHESAEGRPPAYERLAPAYQHDAAFRARQLAHRPAEALAGLDGHVLWLSWADLMDRVLDASAALNGPQRLLLRRLVDYLKDRHLLFKGG